MDYMGLIKRSVSNAWKYKFLWLFGFFAAWSNGSVGHIWTDKIDKYDGFRFGRYGDFYIEPALIAMLLMAAFAIFVIVWVLSVLSEGALIYGITRKEFDLDVTFGQCWSVGLRKFFRLFGIILLAFVLVIGSILIIALFLIPVYFLSVVLGVILTIFAIPIFFVLIFVVVGVEGWAIRYAVLNDRAWLDAIADGWRLFKDNIWKTVGIALSSFFTQLVIWLALVICLLIMAIPFIIIGVFSLGLALIPGLLLLFIIIIISEAFFGVFASSMWTLGFVELTGYDRDKAVAVSDLSAQATI
jgi:hypothetical protein